MTGMDRIVEIRRVSRMRCSEVRSVVSMVNSLSGMSSIHRMSRVRRVSGVWCIGSGPLMV